MCQQLLGIQNCDLFPGGDQDAFFFEYMNGPFHLGLRGPCGFGQLHLGHGDNIISRLDLGQIEVQNITDSGQAWLKGLIDGIKKQVPDKITVFPQKLTRKGPVFHRDLL